MKFCLTIIFLFFYTLCFCQPNKPLKTIEFKGLTGDIKFDIDSGVATIHRQILARVKEYPIDTSVYYMLVKGDTMIEVIRYYSSGVAYDFYIDNSQFIRYTDDRDSSSFWLTLMRPDMTNIADWIIDPKRTSITEYDQNGDMEKYHDEILSGTTGKIICDKSWSSGKYLKGQLCTYKKNKMNKWDIISCKNISESEWP